MTEEIIKPRTAVVQKPTTEKAAPIRDLSERVVSDIERTAFGGGSGLPIGPSRPNPDQSKKKLDFNADFDIDPANPQVTVDMNVDKWVEVLSITAELPEWPLWSTLEVSSLSAEVNGELVPFSSIITYRPNNFFAFELKIGGVSFPAIASPWDKTSSREYEEFLLRIISRELKNNGCNGLVTQNINGTFLKISVAQESSQSIRKEVEKMKKAISIAAEVFLKSLNQMAPDSIKIPNPNTPTILEPQTNGKPASSADNASDEVREKVKALEVSNITLRLDDMGGNEDLKVQIRQLIAQYTNPQFFIDRGVTLPKGILLYGPPGTGKTLAAKIFAGEIGRKFYHVKSSDILSAYYGESEKVLKAIFEHVEGPCIIFIDEIDSIGENREHASEPTRRVLTELLQRLDGMGTRSDIILLAATNRRENLDPALLRAGRFDRHILVNKPDEAARKQVWNIYIEKGQKKSRVKLFEDSIDTDMLAAKTDGMVGADIEEIVRRLKEKVTFESFESGNDVLVSQQMLLDEIQSYVGEKIMVEKEKKREIGFRS